MTTTMIETRYDTRDFDSPVGLLTLVASATGLRAVLWHGDDLARAGLAGATLAPGRNGVLDEAARQLEEYFARVRTSFDLPLDLRGTPFQVAAWEALAAIPYGETRTYAEQAARTGRPNAVRAIGAANGRNPISIVLPCHRVVGSDGALRGFAGGLDVKAALLAFEHAHASPTTG
jgi:methylated-DNA-[protein]-cysteine S-methyltransferase